MSDERDVPAGCGTGDGRRPDADAWARACAEDLAAEKARRRDRGEQPGSAAEELRKLVDTVADRLTALRSPLLGAAAGQMARQFVRQAKAAVEPVIERNPDVFDHLAAAGSELLAAYRSAVEHQEQRWTARQTGAAPGAGDAADGTGTTGSARPAGPARTTGTDGTGGTDGADAGIADHKPDDEGEDPGPGQRIDLD